MSDQDLDLTDMTCFVCEARIGTDVAVFLKPEGVRHIPGSPHCKYCPQCDGQCLRPRDHRREGLALSPPVANLSVRCFQHSLRVGAKRRGKS